MLIRTIIFARVDEFIHKIFINELPPMKKVTVYNKLYSFSKIDDFLN